MYDTLQQVLTDSVASGPASAYARQYSGVVDKAAADVATHISKCGEDLIGMSADLGVDEADLRAALVEVGLAVEREPEVAAASGDTESRLTAIEDTLVRLSRIAERAEQYLR